MKPLLKLLFIRLIHGSKEPRRDVNIEKKSIEVILFSCKTLKKTIFIASFFSL